MDAANKSYVDDVTDYMLSGLQIVQSSTSNSFSGWESHSHTAYCPSGMRAIGGGVISWRVEGGGNIHMLGSASIGNGWWVSWWNSSNDEATADFIVQAICVRVN